jgi:hypothetical protein
LPGLISLLLNGHFLSDWTLYKGMQLVLPDCAAEWTENKFNWKSLWAVKPTQDQWETGWDDLVDQIYELAHRTIARVLKTQSRWILPLSAGLDSRLVAAVGAEIGSEMYAYTWGASDTTDVVYSKQIARTLGIPRKHIDLSKNFLIKYTPQWADCFGSGMHFHGMYMLCFLDALRFEPDCPIISGFLGDVLTGDGIASLDAVHSSTKSYQMEDIWYSFWTSDEVRSLMRIQVDDALEANASELKRQIDTLPGAWHQKLQFLELWNRQRLFTCFQATLSDYWRGVATPFIDREYACFFFSLPRATLDGRRLLKDVYRRYFGGLAVIPGTYGVEPLILTGRYLLRKRIASLLHKSLQYGPFSGFDHVPLRMDMESVQASGNPSLWPIHDTWNQLSEWLDVGQIHQTYQAIMTSLNDVRPQRKLLAVQALAYRLL